MAEDMGELGVVCETAMRRSRLGRTALVVVCLAPLAGCRTAPKEGLEFRETVAPEPSHQQVMVGRSVEGRLITCEIFGTGDDVVLIMATIHGTEPAGTPLVHRLAEHLRRHPELLEGRRIILLAVANPDGMACGTRCNMRRVDLNRNFPAQNWANRPQNGPSPLSEPESRAVFDLIVGYAPDRIVSIHQPLACIDYDGPGRGLAEAMSAASGLPVRRLGGQPGSLGSYVGGTRGVAIVTVELPGFRRAPDAEALWKRYGDMLLTAITFGGK
ncbi:MAG: DUF2817 domain-containing protein [Phycisphaerae bacterium]|nr:DUF2817 domain-containing protein [Phycisphaerae bacterium]